MHVRHIMSGSNIFCAGFTSEGVMWHASCHPSSYITHITKWNKDSCLHMRNNFGCSQQFWMFSCLYVVSCMRGCVLPYANVQAEGWTPKSKRSSLLFVYILALPSLMLTLALIFTSFVSIFLVHYYIVWQDCAPMSYCLYQPLFLLLLHVLMFVLASPIGYLRHWQETCRRNRHHGEINKGNVSDHMYADRTFCIFVRECVLSFGACTFVRCQIALESYTPSIRYRVVCIFAAERRIKATPFWTCITSQTGCGLWRH